MHLLCFRGLVTGPPAGTSVAPPHRSCCVVGSVFPTLTAKTEPAPAKPAGHQTTGPGSPDPTHPHPYLPPPRGHLSMGQSAGCCPGALLSGKFRGQGLTPHVHGSPTALGPYILANPSSQGHLASKR